MNGRRRFLTASVISVQNSNFVYPSCQNCFSRLHLDLERYCCLKCGCSGRAREANYRYRLSLEVADTHRVFLVTVFGSCLEAFFGVTAKSLQRYIEDLNPEAGEASREASPSVVIQAVETCFVGKKFIFGVKASEKQDGAGHSPKALTACQMFAPNPELTGCTVLRYLHQRQCFSGSKGSHGGRWSPGGLFTALDQPSSELSSLHGSGDWDAVPSIHTHCLSGLWPQSFGLISSSISGGTTADPAALDLRTACNEQKWDRSPVSLKCCNQSVDNFQDDNLTVNEKKVQEGDKFSLCPTCHNSTFVTREAQSHSSESDDTKAMQGPLQIANKDSPGKISIQRHCGLKTSQNSQQGYSFCPLISCNSHSRDGGSSQDDPWLWDELPSSESLNEFIARIEHSNTIVAPTETRSRGCFPSKEAGKIWPPLQLDATSTTGQAHEKLQEVAEKVGMSKKTILFCHQLSLGSKEYQQEASFSTLSTQGKGERKHLSDHHQIPLPQLSPAGIKPSELKGSCLSSKEGVDRDATSHENDHASSSLKTAGNCFRSPADLNSKCEGNVTGWRKEESSHCEPKQTACEKLDKVREGQALPEAHKNNCRGEISNLQQNSSICPHSSYNASAELFDASATGAEVVIGTGQAFSAQGGALTAKFTAPGCKPSELETSWNTFQSGLSLLDFSAASEPKTSTPDTNSARKMECGPSNTQDFVPSSQSTPCVRPWHQAKLTRGKESVLSELPLNGLPWISAKGKRPQPAFKNPLVKQLVRKFLQSRRSSNVSSAARDTSMSQGLFINGSPTQELSENDGAEWIPPSEKKWRTPLPFQNKKTFGFRRKCGITEKTPVSEKQARWKTLRGTIQSTSTEFFPKNQQPTKVNEDVADPVQVTVASPGVCIFSGCSRLNLSPTPHSTPETVNWSPELFGDNS